MNWWDLRFGSQEWRGLRDLYECLHLLPLLFSKATAMSVDCLGSHAVLSG